MRLHYTVRAPRSASAEQLAARVQSLGPQIQHDLASELLAALTGRQAGGLSPAGRRQGTRVSGPSFKIRVGTRPARPGERGRRIF
ncbi:MAG: hypothetical protein WD249_01710 [Gaiellaceae bacterium]